MKTYSAKPGEITRDWYVVDAEGKTLGRLATQIADRLRGKGKPQYTPHVDTGDFVVVVNAEKIAVTGNKLDDKMYYRHSGYPGGLKERPLREQLERRPTEVLRRAVKGMLPKNRLARQQITKLKIYAGPEHPHEAQAPKPFVNVRLPGPVPRHRQAQDVRRPRDPASRRRQDLDQRQDDRGVLPAARPPQVIMAPLEMTELQGQYDLRVRVHGGGPSGQAGAVRHGIARALVEINPDFRVLLKRQGFLTRDAASGRAQEGRPAQGAQGAAVLEALDARHR